MLSKSGFRPVLALIVLLLTALACNFGGEDPTPTPEPAPANTAVPTAAPDPTEVPEPTATADPTEGFESYTSEEMGLTVGYPADWAIEDFFFINLASSQELLEDTEGMTEGAALIIFAAPSSDYESTDPLVLVQQSADEFAAGEDATSVGEPESLTINGQDAAKVRVAGTADDGTPLIVSLYVIVSGDRVATIIAATPEASESEYAAVIEAIAGTVDIFEPTVVEEEDPVVTVDPTEGLEEISQWASSAVASSEFGNPSWGAVQATGERDTFECGDFTTAWASDSSDTVEWLEVYFDVPVYPRLLQIAQTYSPDQVVLVELIDTDGNYHEISSKEPVEGGCPLVTAITVMEPDYMAVGARITIDQSVLGTSWNEIDAVELIGSGEAVGGPVEEPVVEVEIPAGFLWRAGGESGIFEGEFAALGGMDVDGAGNLYIADNTHGLYVYDVAGNELNVLDQSDFNNTTDVKVAPNGNLVVADWAADTIFVLSPDGDIITQFGGEGTGPGLFDTFSPGAVAVGPDGRIYAHDDTEDEAGEDIERIQIFSEDGTFLSAFTIEEDLFSLSGMDFGPDGNLYLVGFIGHAAILKYSPEGELLGKLGDDALAFTGPQGIFIDDAGFMYVSTWSDTPIIKLDPEGNLVGTFGIEINENETAWIEGGFYQPSGITGLSDGSVIFVTDWSGGFAFITAFSFVE